MRKVFTACFVVLLISACAAVYKNSLGARLADMAREADARVGIAVLRNTQQWTVGNEKQPLLSVFKFFIALKVLNEADNGRIHLKTRLKIDESMADKRLYSPMLEKYTAFPFDVSVAELMEYMISESDNNASDILLEYVGGAEELERYVHGIGFDDIEISVNEKEMNTDIEKQYLNKARARDVAKAMRTAREGNLLSAESRSFLNKIMMNTVTGPDKIRGGLPGKTKAGHKTGSSSRKADGTKIADNDAGFVLLPNGETFYIAVMITDSKMSDTDNAGLIRRISKTVYDHLAGNAAPDPVLRY